MSFLPQRLVSNKPLLIVALLVGVYLLLRIIALLKYDSSPLEGSYFSYEGKQVRYLCQGKGAPYVIFETGFGSDSEQTWSGVVKALPKDFTACYYDRLGHGGSDDVPRTFTTEQKSQLQEALINHIASGEPVVLVASSYGGIISRRTVARNEVNLAALILLDSAHENQHEIMRGRLDPISDSVKNMQYANAIIGLTQIKNLFKQYDSPLAQRLDQHYSSLRWAHILSTYRNEKGFYTPLQDLNYDFGDLKLIVMSQDKEVYANNPRFSGVVEDWAKMQKDIAALSSNSQHMIVKGASHNIAGDAPQAVVSKITETVNLHRTGP